MQVKRNSKHVVIVQRRLTSYRIRLFELMREKLTAEGVELSLIVGSGTAAEEMKQDGGNLDWAIKVPTKYFLSGKLCWQPFARYAKGADLVVVTQENKLLSNYLAMTIQRPKRLAFWGHGANLQSSSPHGLKEKFKRWSALKADWWFGYTSGTASRLRSYGFSGERIVCLENAVDTNQLASFRDGLSSQEIDDLKSALGIAGCQVGVYVGSLYADKRLDFLFAAADLIRQQMPQFRLLVVGDGPMRDEIKSLCQQRSDWCQWLGPKHGRDKVAHLLAADVMLTPAAVGLAILDSFVSARPLVTTTFSGHGPEIDYLEDGVNGLVTEPSAADYAQSVIRILTDASLLQKLQDGCRQAASRYTVENMANNFCRGINRALAS